MCFIGHNLLATYARQADFFGCMLRRMSEKPMTVAEMARMGGLARAKAHSKAQLRASGKRDGRPTDLDNKAQGRLEKNRNSCWPRFVRRQRSAPTRSATLSRTFKIV